MKTLAESLTEHRKAYGINMTELAHKTNITLSTISRLETGNRTPTMTTLIEIAAALNTTIESLIDGVVLDQNSHIYFLCLATPEIIERVYELRVKHRFNTEAMLDELGISVSNFRRMLDAGKHNLTTPLATFYKSYMAANDALHNPTEKQCSICDEVKPVSEFFCSNRLYGDGYHSYCKECHCNINTENSRKRMVENPQKERDRLNAAYRRYYWRKRKSQETK